MARKRPVAVGDMGGGGYGGGGVSRRQGCPGQRLAGVRSAVVWVLRVLRGCGDRGARRAREARAGLTATALYIHPPTHLPLLPSFLLDSALLKSHSSCTSSDYTITLCSAASTTRYHLPTHHMRTTTASMYNEHK